MDVAIRMKGDEHALKHDQVKGHVIDEETILKDIRTYEKQQY